MENENLDYPEKSIEVASGDINRFTNWFRQSKAFLADWRKRATESFDFVEGKQWSDGDKAKLKADGRPAITINRIKPLINILSGYQRTNRYDIDFLPRTNDDAKLCDVRKAMTKYVMDRSDFDTEESTVFINGAICGLGWFEVGYQHNEDLEGEGEAFVRSESPFNIFIDPEAKKLDYSDGKYIIRAKWVDKEELCDVYPEKKDFILAKISDYDTDDYTIEQTNSDLFYNRERKKLRLCECWYKVRDKQYTYLLPDGSIINVDRQNPISPHEQALLEQYALEKSVSVHNNVRVCAFFDDVMLEDMDSPYQHGEFPFVPFIAYHYDENELPSGVVDSAKDLQRELNKRRSEMLHIINTSSHSGWIFEREAMDARQKHDFAKNASRAGAMLEVKELSRMQQLVPPSPPVAIMQSIADNQNDIREVTGINETMMGTDIPNSASGRAIELKQKQAITHIIPLFDALRQAKKKLVYLLWGKRGRQGIIPQFYTEEKVYRIEGDNQAYSFMTVNQQQQIPTNDPLMPVITKTLNDLSEGEFDIVIADVTASTTQREAQFWSLTDAVSKMGIPGDMVFDLLIDLSNVPHKEDIKERYQQRQQEQQQAQQAQMQQQLQLEAAKNNRVYKNINIKDLPLPAQLAMLAKEGLVDPALAQSMMSVYVQAMNPALGQQQAQLNQMQMGNDIAQEQGVNPNDLQQQALMEMASRAYDQSNTNAQSGGRAVTKPAMQSILAGQQPAL